MGQLERYGLYVLCLVIFLILGIAIWGDSATPAIPKDTTGTSLNVTSSIPPGDVISHERLKELEAEAHMNDVIKIMESKSEPADLPLQEVKPNVPATEGTSRTPLPVEKPEVRIHVVKEYETLEEISLRYLGKRHHWRQILDLNPNVRPTALRPGMKLKIPPRKAEKSKAGKSKAVATVPGTVIVRRGDNPGLISQRLFGTTKYADEIMRLNNISDPTRLRIGAELKVPQIDPTQKKR